MHDFLPMQCYTNTDIWLPLQMRNVIVGLLPSVTADAVSL